MPEHISLHQSSDHRLPALRLWAPLLILSLLPAFACGRYRARHELERDKYFAQIIQRVDHRWMGEDRFFEDNLLANPYPEVRKGCAIALGQIGSPHALPLLYRAVRTGDASVRAASAFAIGQIEDRERLIKKNLAPDPEATTALLFLLRDPSLTVQMRAIEALGKSGSQLEAAEIVRQVDRFAYTGSPTDRAYIGFAITALARLKDPIALAELERWGKAENSELRSSALEALALLNRTGASPTTGSATDSGSAPVSPVAADRVRDMPARPSAVTDTVGLALAANRRNSTIAMVETARGPLEIELFRADAPRTVASFVLQAKRGSYNGFVFDEIVPAKKIEGNITGSQVGFNIAPDGEINMRPFERGSVGLSFANENSPNGRFFIALAPQPYLDGVDTCFGRVISGMQIADKLTAGDRILGIHIAETTALGDRVRY